jgi:TRAP-type C4-dicarboxylate transport system permease small subunit
MDWTPTLWIIFNFLLFGLVFGIMSIFTIVTIIQYIVNFTIKPLMNDPDDIKNILKCNVHTLILFFCLLTIYTSSEYLDDTSTIVMSVVTVLYFIRTVIIYFQG